MPSPINAETSISKKVYDYLEYINDIIYDARFKRRFVFNFEISDDAYNALKSCIPHLKKYYKGGTFCHRYQPYNTTLPVQKCHQLVIQFPKKANAPTSMKMK